MSTAPLVRTASGPFHSPPAGHHHDAAGVSLLRRSRSSGSLLSQLSLHLEQRERWRPPAALRRVRSAAGVAGSDGRSTPHSIEMEVTEVEEEEEERALEKEILGLGILSEASVEAPVEVQVGGGAGRRFGGVKGGGVGGGRIGGGEGAGDERREMAAYYEEMLKADPGNPLLLRNYGRFLHEVEGDVVGAEECYGRAVLAAPADGEVLSLYGRLIWEADRDEARAGAYFERAVEASPDDCYVLGSYANFLWDVDHAQEAEEEKEETSPSAPSSSQQQQLVKAY